MLEDKLIIRMLGGLEVQYRDKVVGINNSEGKSKKMWVLFEYLLINYSRKIPQAELIDILWPNGEVSNPANSLKVLAFKLRKELDRLEYLTGKEIVSSVHGAYSFNEAIPHEIDVVEFENILNESKKPDVNQKKQLELLFNALKCFKGAVLSDTYKEPWAASLQTHYNQLYKQAVKSAVEILTEKGNYEKVIELSKDALLIQPFEENYYYYLIRAYAAMENYSAASEMYKQVQLVMEKEYGTTIDRKFENVYKDLMKDRPKKNLTVEELTDVLEEKTNFVASFYVEFGEFKQIYRLMARRLERLKNGAYMCIYTLGAKKGVEISTEEKREHMTILSDALAFTLRQGDVFTRATPNQFAVIFIDISEENAQSIAKRISKYFSKHRTSDDFGVIHTIAPIEPSDFEKKHEND